MRDELIAIAIIIIPTVLLLVAWKFCNGRNNARRRFLIIFITVAIALLFIGAMTWQPHAELSQAASMALASSTILFSGPFLVWTVGKDWSMLWSVSGALILIPISTSITIFVLFSTKQVWGL